MIDVAHLNNSIFNHQMKNKIHHTCIVMNLRYKSVPLDMEFYFPKTPNTCQDYKSLISYDKSKISTVFGGYS